MSAPNRSTMRLLPWTREDGAPCYVVGDGHGPVSRIADEVEAVQLAMSAQLVEHAEYLLAEPEAGQEEVRYLAGCLCSALTDVLRVAEARGGRLGDSSE